MNEELLRRLFDLEDAFIERKPEGCNARELRKEIVAFANSLKENEYAVIFIGVSDDGKPLGLNNPDEKQKKIRRVAESECYPPVDIQMHVLKEGEYSFLAVVIRHSLKKPHFSGPAYVRIGSECINATAEKYEELINSRSDICRAVQEHKEKVFHVIANGKKLGDDEKIQGKWRSTHDCRVEKCNQHYIQFYDIKQEKYLSEPIEYIRFSYDKQKDRPVLTVSPK